MWDVRGGLGGLEEICWRRVSEGAYCPAAAAAEADSSPSPSGFRYWRTSSCPVEMS